MLRWSSLALRLSFFTALLLTAQRAAGDANFTGSNAAITHQVN